MNQRALAFLFVPIAAAATAPAYADVTFHGFGQVAVGSTLSNHHSNFPSLSYTADPSFRPESLFALQVQAPLADKISATAQLVAAGSQNNDFTPSFEWAYIAYQINDTWAVKAGRQRLPLYKYSDYLEVGQAYPWIRPPSAVYQGYISNYDGLSANGYYEFGDWVIQPQVTYGTVDRTFSTPDGTSYSFKENNNATANVEFEYADWLSFRLGFSYAAATINVSSLDAAIDAIGTSCQIMGIIPGTGTDPSNPPIPTCSTAPASTPQGAVTPPAVTYVDNSSVVDGLKTNNDSSIFYSAGFEIHKYNFILASEYNGFRFNDSLFFSTRQYYASLGYQWGKLTPMLTYGHVDQSTTNPGVLGQVAPGSGVLVGVASLGAAGYETIALPADMYVGGLIGTQRSLDDYYEFGVRYDTTKNTAIKLDFTRHMNHNPVYTQADGTPSSGNDQANVLSAAFVFVF